MSLGIMAVYSKELSEASGSPRYIMVDAQTREVIDDCNGDGYRSARSAYLNFHSKLGVQVNTNRASAWDDKRDHIFRWMREHPDFVGRVNKLKLSVARGELGKKAKINAALIREMLAEDGLHPDFSAGDFLRAYNLY